MQSLKSRKVDAGQLGVMRLDRARLVPVAALLLLAAKPAWAGYWEEVPLPPQGDPTYQTEIARRYKGTATYDKSQGLWPNVQFFPTDEKDKVQDIATRPTSVWGSDATSGGHLHLHYNVQRRSIFRWVRNRIGYNTDDPNDNPDEFLYLKIVSSASAQSDRDTPLAGESGTSVASASADGTTAAVTEYPYFDWYTGVQRLHTEASTGPVVKMQPWPAGKDEVEGPWVSADAEIFVSGGRYSSGSSSGGGTSYSALAASASAGYSYEAHLLTRYVMISSSADTSYFKGADGEPQPHLRSGHGPGVGDTVAPWTREDESYSFSWKIDTSYTAIHTFWPGSVCVWDAGNGTASPPPTNEEYHIERRLADAKSFPQSQSLQVTVTDAQEPSITATNSYGMTWHLPYERFGAATVTPEGRRMDRMLDRFHSGTQSIPPQPGEVIGHLAGGGLEGGSYYSPDADAAEQIVFQLTDAPRSYAWSGTPGNTDFTNDQDTWDLTVADPDSQGNFNPPDIINRPSGWQGCDMEVWKVMRFKHTTWAADHYNLNGFESTGHKLFVNTDHKIRFEPYYFANNTSSGSNAESPSE